MEPTRKQRQPISRKPSGEDDVRPNGLGFTCLLLVLLIVVVAAAFAPAFDGGFLNWDDDRNIVTNTAFDADAKVPSRTFFRWAWETYHLGVWQPVSWMLLGVQWSVAGLAPPTYHLTSAAIHVINCLLLYMLIVRLIAIWHAPGGTTPIPARSKPGRVGVSPAAPARSASEGVTHASPTRGDAAVCSSVRFGAAAATILFAVHPLRVEPVVWISCQPYLPAAMFYLLSVLAYLRAADARGSIPRSRFGLVGGRLHFAWLAASLVCFMLALGSKAAAVSLPVVLIVLDIWVLRRWARPWSARQLRCLLEKLPFVIVAIPVCLWAVAAKDYSASRAPWAEFELGPRLAQAAYGLVFYPLKTILPVGLSPYYRIPPGLELLTWPYAVCAAAVVALTILLIVRRRRWPTLLAAWLAYVLILLPNLGLVQISQQLAADRYSYLGLMPFVILIAALLGGLWRRARDAGTVPRAGLAFVVLGMTTACILATRAYASHWTNSQLLWQRVLALDPDSAVAHCNLGEALIREGRYADASYHLSRAIDLEPDFSFAYVNFAALLLQVERYEDAAGACEHAIVAHPPLYGLDLARAHAICGEAYAALRRYDPAWRHTLRAKELGFAEAGKMLEYLRQFTDGPPETGAAAP